MSLNKKMLTEIESNLRDSGIVTFEIADTPISFDLSNRHERYYAASFLMNLQYPQFDIDLALFRRFVQSGDRVLDAGANIGVTALKLLEFGASRVIASEPIPELFDRLSSLPEDRIICINQAISSSIGHATMTVSLTHNQGSSLKDEVITLFPSIFGETHQKISVPVTTIDALHAEYGHFDIWKLDIEGAEVDAVIGGRETQNHAPPRVIIAELFGELQHPFYAHIKETHPYGYRAFLRKADYELVFTDIDIVPDASLHHTSPMFVFLRQPIA